MTEPQDNVKKIPIKDETATNSKTWRMHSTAGIIIAVFCSLAVHLLMGGVGDDRVDFIEWLQANNVLISSKVSIIDIAQDNRDMITTEDIEVDELLVSIPRNMLLWDQHPDVREVVSKVIGTNPDTMEILNLAVFLIASKDNPHWSHFINVLPKSWTTPLFYNDHQLGQLNGTWLHTEVLKGRNYLRRNYESFKSKLPKGTTFDDLLGAWTNVNARVFAAYVDHPKKWTPTMAPFIDMANHAGNSPVRAYYLDKSNTFVLTAVQPIQKGNPIHVYYGNESNSELLLTYGFTLNGNDHDSNKCQITFNTAAINPEFDTKAMVCEVRHELSDTFTQECLRRIRDVAELGDDVVNNDPELMSIFIQGIENTFQLFATDLEDDTELLALAEDFPTWYRDVIRARRSEKICLMSLLEQASAIIADDHDS